MSIVIEPVSPQDFNTTMKAIWGTREKMMASPLYKEVEEHQQYLRNLIDRTVYQTEKEISELKWWDLYHKLMSPLIRFSVKKMIVIPGEKLIKRYEGNKRILVGFAVKFTNDEFDEYIKQNEKIIRQVNKSCGFENDPYLK